MRVISLVPSITETLLEAGVDVVGRTRFCIHPKEKAKQIPAVGGTKDLNWEKLRELKPDLLILDREENLPWMKADAPCEVLTSHVTSVSDQCDFSETLCATFSGNKALQDFAKRWRTIEQTPPKTWSWSSIPGAIESWIDPKSNPKEILYLIWKDPWMSVANGTFISSVFAKLGAAQLLVSSQEKYPKVEFRELNQPGRVCLFSSEPFPFARHSAEMRTWAPQGALVDGESWSWFGVRTLRFLERELELR